MNIHDVIIQASIVTFGVLVAQIIKLIVNASDDLIFGRDE